MKKNLLILGLIAFMGLTTVSCSTDDSDMNIETAADGELSGNGGVTPPVDNGDKELPKPPMKP